MRMFLLAMFTVIAGAGAADDLNDLLGNDGTSTDPVATGMGPETPADPAPPEHPALGASRLQAHHDPEITYLLYLPAAYEHQPQRRLPQLYLQNPGGRPKLERFQAWAERRGVILVGIEKVSNGMKQHFKPRFQDGVLKDLNARGVRVHPHLALTNGMSGGSADGVRMARRMGRRFAGVMLQGAGRIPTNAGTEHLIFAVLHGAKDNICQAQGLFPMVEEARSAGRSVRIHVDPQRRHEWAPDDEQMWCLDWMLALAKLTNPYLSQAERTQYREDLLTQMQAATTIADPTERRRACERLLELDPLTEADQHPALVTAWASAIEELARNESRPYEAHATLAMALASPFAVHLTEADRNRLTTRAADLAADPAVARDWQLRQACDRASDQEARAGLDREALAAVATTWQQVAKEAGDHRWGDLAQARADGIKRLLQR